MRHHPCTQPEWLGLLGPRFRLLRSRVEIALLAAGLFGGVPAPTAASAPPAAGPVFAWGGDWFGEIDVPGGLTNAVAVTGGAYFTLALGADGTVAAWGCDTNQQAAVPPGLGNVRAIAAGGTFSLALRNDGTVVTWGDDSLGQTDLPPGLGKAQAIAAGHDFSLALQADGTLIGWGNANPGLTNLPPGLADVTAIAAGQTFGLALSAEGTVTAWGDDAHGEIEVPRGLTNVIAISASCEGLHALALTAGGTVVAWGANDFGQTNVPPGLEGVVAIAAGSLHSLALRADGTVVAWGANGEHQTDVPPGLIGVAAIGGGALHSLAIVRASPPSVIQQPASQTVCIGSNAAFVVVAQGTPPLNYQWRFNGTNLSWALSGHELPLAGVQLSDGGKYDVIISNIFGTVTSLAATLTLTGIPPVIVTQPTNQTTYPGGPANFIVGATGVPAPAYLWRCNGVALPWAMTSEVALSNIPLADAGAQYDVLVTNLYGAVTSAVATLNVAYLPVAWTNLNGGSWTNDANWFPHAVPDYGLNVQILLDGSYTITLDADRTVHSLLFEGATNAVLDLGGHQLTLAVGGVVNSGTIRNGTLITRGALSWSGGCFTNGTLKIPADGRFAFSGGSMSGLIEVNGSEFDWAGGGRLDGAEMDLDTNGVLNLTGSPDFVLHQSNLENLGTINWLGLGRLVSVFDQPGQSAWIVNQGQFLIASNSTLTVSEIGNGSGTFSFENLGRVTKAAGGGVTTLSAVRFDNAGDVEVQNGTLAFASGFTGPGGMVIAGGATLALTGGGATLTPANTVTGPGTFQVSGCTLTVNGVNAFNTLVLTNTGVLTYSVPPADPGSGQLHLVIARDLRVDPTSRIDAMGLGYGAASGPGAGGSAVKTAGSGAGHGGAGGVGSEGAAVGPGYDDPLNPVMPGSGGGNGYSCHGGCGGGVVRLKVGGTFWLDGVMVADGTPGSAVAAGGLWGGGGAGGTIVLDVSQLGGYGLISANGGAATSGLGGGGGGGRVAIFCGANTFRGSVAAYGGPGLQYGGAGSVLVQVTGGLGDLGFDNGGNAGQVSPLAPLSAPCNLIIGNLAVVVAPSSLSNANLDIRANGRLTSLAGEAVKLTVATNLTVEAGGVLDLAGKGLGAGHGPGAGASAALGGGGGGGHGGMGGNAAAPGGGGYGSPMAPNEFGSGGGNGFTSAGGTGGGNLQLTVGGTLQVDGALCADGQDAPGPGYNLGGGGAGGSLAITATTLSGRGTVSANGGGGSSGGGGGGGRIAVLCSTNAFRGTLSAYGGAGTQCGGAGSLFLKLAGEATGSLVLDNGSNPGQITPLPALPPCNLVIGNQAEVLAPSSLTVASLVVRPNGRLTTAAGQSLNLTISGDLVVQTGGVLDLSGAGYGAGLGPGAGGSVQLGGGGGASHGGEGGSTEANTGDGYGSVVAPSELGSGGGNGFCSGGGSGGGSLQLSVGGTLRVDGALRADGEDGAGTGYTYGGGGAGGSLFITATSVAGVGAISANGGAGGTQGGGGGGGRLALYYGSSSFAGTLSAWGGDGASRGGAGTIFTEAAGAPCGLAVVDNGGNPGLTRLDNRNWPFNLIFDLTVAGSAEVIPDMPLTFRNIVLTSGAKLSHDPVQRTLQLVATGDFLIETNSAVIADGLGYGLIHGTTNGPGVGGFGSDTGGGGGGGGYGGFGGAGRSGGSGGTTYGSATQPLEFGSGGGPAGYSYGGAGGGFIRLSAARIMKVNGRISANGGSSQEGPMAYLYSGAGSGGSIFLTAGILSATGPITANGGAAYQGGGGGGGRIAIYGYVEVDLTTQPVAAGGLGGDGTDPTRNGLPGTVISSTNLPPFQVVGQAPSGFVTQPLSFVDVTFNAGTDPGTVNVTNVAIWTPTGPLDRSQISILALGGPVFRLSFPVETSQGQYYLLVGPFVTDLYGRPMDQHGDGIAGEPDDVYIGTITLGPPVTISGIVRLANGAPAGGVLLSTDDGLSALTDAGGHYTLTVIQGWSGTVTPAALGCSFAPTVRMYTSLSNSVASQNYMMTIAFGPALTSLPQPGGFLVTWASLAGVQYQLQTSIDLHTWVNVGSPLPGTGGALSWLFDSTLSPRLFVRIQASIGSIILGPTATITGAIYLANGVPASGVLVQTDDGFSALTDAQGFYTLGVNQGWSGTVTPSKPGGSFAPANRSYANLTNGVTGQVYTLALAPGPTLGSAAQPGGFQVTWLSLAGVRYQLQVSTDLRAWTNLGPPITGTGNALSRAFNSTLNPRLYVRIMAEE